MFIFIYFCRLHTQNFNDVFNMVNTKTNKKTHKVFFKPLKVLTQHNSTIRSVVVVLMNMKF